jgi:3-deoxy-7-phosphoheptulonate synthase
MPQTVKLTEFTSTRAAAPWMTLPATQQPHWHHHPDYDLIEAELSGALPLVAHSEIREAKRALGLAALGEARVLQLGDCAESFSDVDPVTTSGKVRNVQRLASRLAERTGQQVARFGRMAGQYAKPRSSNFETVGGVDLPSFRGELVNSFEAENVARRHDPERMLRAYDASAAVLREVRTHWSGSAEELAGGPWVAHEALVLDYENALIRTDERTGEQFLTSTHFPWIGERTRQLDHAHVSMFSAIANPIGVKVGPTADPETVVRLCRLLDPRHTPGRLTLIVRMGREDIHVALAPIVRAVRRAGHPVVWISDPMHGNTVKAECGQKTRFVSHIIEEATAFRHILETEGAHAAGLHLEVAATDVTECVGGSVPDELALSERYESLCDPRLNPDQALGVIDSVF